MKELLKLNDVYVEIKENMLLEKMNVTVKQGDVIGLIGKMVPVNQRYSINKWED